MKGVVEEFLIKTGMREDLKYDPTDKKPFLHPGRQADIFHKGVKIGYMGELHPMVRKNYEIGERTLIAVLDMPEIVRFANFSRKYVGLARFPAVNRDLSMVVPKNVLAGDIENMIRVRGGKLLENVSLFDIYEGEQIKEGYKSMAYTLTLRNREKTLSDEEITSVMKKILNGLEGMGIELRS